MISEAELNELLGQVQSALGEAADEVGVGVTVELTNLDSGEGWAQYKVTVTWEP